MRREAAMDKPLRVIHYVNQFFGGLGGEEVANVGVSVRNGAVGAGRALQQALEDQGSIIGTLVCGDNYIHDKRDAALTALETPLRELRPDVVVAGPAFASGRYGLACTEVCKLARALGFAAVTGMHPENPGAQGQLGDL